jgi:hypothetical protein
MARLRDSSEIKEAASLLSGLLGEQSSGRFREVKLDRAIAALCDRAGFSSAAVVDERGLPIAVRSTAFPADNLAAFTAILGDALVRAAGVLGKGAPTSLSVDVDYTSKAFVRRFVVRDLPYLLVVFCPQDVDAQPEIELAIEPLAAILR